MKKDNLGECCPICLGEGELKAYRFSTTNYKKTYQMKIGYCVWFECPECEGRRIVINKKQKLKSFQYKLIEKEAKKNE